MLTRFIISCVKSSGLLQKNLAYSPIYQYSNLSSEKEVNPFHYKIIQLNNNNDFFAFCKQNKSEFDSHSFSIAAKTLGRLIFENKNHNKFIGKQFEQLTQFLQSLKQVKHEELSPSEFMTFLQLTRTMQNKQIMSRKIREYIQYLKNEAQKIVPKIIDQTSQLYQLAYFYHQVSFLDIKQSNLIAQKILKTLRDQKQQNKTSTLTTSIILQILTGMKDKQQLNSHQKSLLSQIIKKINQELMDRLNFFDLVRISGFLNSIIDNIGQKHSNFYVSPIFNKILSNIDQLDEKSIMFILSGGKTNNQTYKKIYYIIFQKIFDQIQTSGQSSFNKTFTMKILAAISSKIKLYRTTQTNQQKFFAFLRQTIPNDPKFINYYVKTMIDNQFLNRNHLERLVQILQSVPNEYTMPLNILFDISQNNINLKSLLKINQGKFQNLKGQNLLIMGEILRVQSRLNRSNQNIKQKLDQIKNLGLKQLDTPQKYSQFVFKLHDKSKLSALNSLFGKALAEKQYEKLFQQKNCTKQFRNAFLLSLVFSQQPQFFIKRKSSLIKSMSNQDIIYMLKIPPNLINDSKIAISNILTIANQKIQLIIEQAQITPLLTRFLNKYCQLLAQGRFYQAGKVFFWAILKRLINSKNNQIILKLNKLIKIVLNSNSYLFNFSLKYHDFIQQLLEQGQNLQAYNKTYQLLILQAIRLNLLKKQTAEKIPKQIIEKLNKKQKFLIQTKLQSYNWNPFENKQFDINTIVGYLSCNNSQVVKIVESNKMAILNYIQRDMKLFQAIDCITYFKLGNNRSLARQIFSKLIQIVNSKTKFFQTVNIFGICKTISRNPSLYNLSGSSQFFNKLLQYFAQDSHMLLLTIEEHIQLIKIANELKIYKMEYMKKVFKHYYQNAFTQNFKQLVLLYARIDYSFAPQELQYIKKTQFFSSSNEYNKSLNIFLLLEDLVTDSKVILQKIIQKSKLEAQQKNRISLIQLKYLQAKYPEITQGWQPKTFQKGVAKSITEFQGKESKNLQKFKIQIQKICGQSMIQKKTFNNTYYKIRNVCISFSSTSKYLGQNKLHQKLLQSFSDDKDSKFITLNQKLFIWSMLRFLDRQNPEFFTNQEKKNFVGQKKVPKQSEQQMEEHDHLP